MVANSFWSWGAQLWLVSSLAMGGANAISGDFVLAQITPDGNLGTESSVVTPTNIDGLPAQQIDGGATRGANLFHSFEQFSVPTGGAAYFNNALNIQNIISRVTGGSVSNIDGLLRANGTANLFLLNPNGISFGPNASLNIGGSFLASTASSLNFADGTQFSATAHPTTPLLTVSVPLGLQYGRTNPGSIRNLSQATDSSGELVGLQVQPGKTLALVGGDVSLDGGTLRAPGGRVELGGVAGTGTVGLDVDGNNLGLSFPGGVARADVSLTNGAFVSLSGEGAGDIQVWGRRVTLTNGSQIQVNTLGSKSGGTLNVTASESVEAIGTTADELSPSGLFTQVEPEATGAGANFTVETGRLILRDGAQIAENIFAQGNGGSLTVTASESVEVIGRSVGGRHASGLSTTVLREAEGDAGDLRIETGRLILRDGALIVATTFGSGSAGNLVVSAREAVEVIGRSVDGRHASALGSQIVPGARGTGGNLTVETGQLIVRDGAQIGTATFGSGSAGNLVVSARKSVEVIGTSADNWVSSALSTSVQSGGTGAGGNLTVETGRLIVQDGAVVTAGTLGAGSGGTLEVRASESVELIGTSINGQSPSLLTAETGGTGDAGDLMIETEQLTVRDGAEVTVSSRGSGKAGNLQLTTRVLMLDSKGAITATTRSGNGGDMILQAQDLLLLRRNSNISTLAGTEQTSGTGGSITINTDNLVALENSDIDANAFGGAGGQVRIDAQAIFGTEGREQKTPLSDITASSDLGPEFSGTVEINTPDVDPSRGLVNLPAVPIETEVVQACTPGGGQQQSEFVVTGRGGLPPSPNEALDSDAIQVDWVTLNPGGENRSSPSVSTNQTTPTPVPLVEAQGWVINDKGEVVLTATAPTVTPHIPWMTPAQCDAPKTSS